MTAIREHVRAEAPVSVRDLTVKFGSSTALDSVSWDPLRGEVTALVGLNGAGKSTLMRAMTGLIQPTSGVIEHRASSGRALSAMIEAPALFTGLSVRRNLEIHRVLTGGAKGEVAELAELVDIADKLGTRVSSLSQGYRQRVAIAVAMLGAPQMLMLDEPTNALDPAAVAHLRTVIRRVADRGVAVVVSSHMLRELEGVADTLTVLHHGTVRYDGPLDDFVGGDRVVARAADPTTTGRFAELLRAAGLPAAGDGDRVILSLARDPDVDGADVGAAAAVDALARQVFGVAARSGVELVELAQTSQTLEQAFHTAIIGDDK